MPCLVFVGRRLPARNAHASEIVFYRHLLRIQKCGFTVGCAVPGALVGSSNLDVPFDILQRTSRKWWWPPSAVLRHLPASVSDWIWRHEILDQVRKLSPDLIVSHVADRSFFQAHILAESLNVPFAAFAHDAPIHFCDEDIPQLKRTLSRTAKVWCVSRPLEKLMNQLGATKTSVLLPIPSKSTPKAQSRRIQEVRRLAIVGSVYEPCDSLKVIDQACERHGLQYSIIAPKPPSNLAELKRGEYVGFFPTPEESLEYVSQNCSGFIIPYPMPCHGNSNVDFLEYSFPSRFLEISQLGLPILITSSPSFAISDWCQEKAPSLLATNSQEIDGWIEMFLSTDGHQALTQAVEKIHSECFDPDAIHADWEEDVIQLLSKNG